MRGRKPVPPVLRLLTGNPGKRGVARSIREQVKAAKASGGVKSTVGDPPRGLPAGARAVWRRIAREAVWLDSANSDLLEAYCRAAHLLRTEPDRLRTAATLVRSLAAELGLSATSRARLSTKPEAPASADDLPPELKRAPGPGGS